MTIVERSLNPCCSGRWSGTAWIYSECAGIISLNPCCSGRWSGTLEFYNVQLPTQSLNPCCSGRWSGTWLDEGTAKEQAMEVLILVVVDDGLVPRLYKTLLIINKLKNTPKGTFTFLN